MRPVEGTAEEAACVFERAETRREVSGGERETECAGGGGHGAPERKDLTESPVLEPPSKK
tara:strand:- start:1193 stop:1372 length:180 start_codon:yes stop_codon:yes gene_type:complete